MSIEASKKNIFDTVSLGKLHMKNRLIRSGTAESLGDGKGHLTRILYDIYEELAQGGVGCIITGATAVADAEIHAYKGAVSLSNDSFIAEHAKLTTLVHKHNCLVFIQLAMGDFYRESETNKLTVPGIDNLTTEDIDKIKQLFVDAAVRSKTAGYDGIQLHVAHGFFLGRFVSPLFNHRQDQYGCDSKRPGQLIAEIITAIHAIEPDLHVSMKINCCDFTPGGLMPEASRLICQECVKAGIDSIEVSGNVPSRPGIISGKNEAYFKDFALALAETVSVPIILVGGLRSVQRMLDVLNEGKIEFLALSRPFLREPSLPTRWHDGDTKPSACISCNRCYKSPAHRCVFRPYH